MSRRRHSPDEDFLNHGWIRINKDDYRFSVIRVHPCSSVVGSKRIMNRNKSFPRGRTRQFLSCALLLVLLAAAIVELRLRSLAQPHPTSSSAKNAGATNEMAALRAEIEQLKGKVP